MISFLVSCTLSIRKGVFINTSCHLDCDHQRPNAYNFEMCRKDTSLMGGRNEGQLMDDILNEFS